MAAATPKSLGNPGGAIPSGRLLSRGRGDPASWETRAYPGSLLDTQPEAPPRG